VINILKIIWIELNKPVKQPLRSECKDHENKQDEELELILFDCQEKKTNKIF